MRWSPTIVAGVLGCIALAACTSGNRSDTVTVAAASSLTDAFTEIGAAFEAVNPDIDVRFNFAGSSELAAQIIEGAPVDVFAAADEITMDRAVEAGVLTGTPRVFATNELALAVAETNPLTIERLDALTDTELVVVLCAPEVPCGSYADAAFADAGVVPSIDSFEENVRSVASKVRLGEADVGVVYATDVDADDDRLDAVPITVDPEDRPRYPIGVVTEAADLVAADGFVSFVLSDEGQGILASYGFSPPGETP